MAGTILDNLRNLFASCSCNSNALRIGCCNQEEDDNHSGIGINTNINATTNQHTHNILSKAPYNKSSIAVIRFCTNSHFVICYNYAKSLPISKSIGMIAKSKHNVTIKIDNANLSPQEQQIALTKQLSSAFEVIPHVITSQQNAIEQLADMSLLTQKCEELIVNVNDIADDIIQTLTNFPEHITHTPDTTIQQKIEDANTTIPALKALFSKVQSDSTDSSNQPAVTSLSNNAPITTILTTVQPKDITSTATTETADGIINQAELFLGMSIACKKVMQSVIVHNAMKRNMLLDSPDAANFVDSGASLLDTAATSFNLLNSMTPIMRPIFNLMGITQAEAQPNLSISVEGNEAHLDCCNTRKTKNNKVKIVMNHSSSPTLATDISIASTEKHVPATTGLLVVEIYNDDHSLNILPLGILSSSQPQYLSDDLDHQLLPGYTLVQYITGQRPMDEITCLAEHALKSIFKKNTQTTKLVLDKNRDVSFYSMETAFHRNISSSDKIQEDILSMLKPSTPTPIHNTLVENDNVASASSYKMEDMTDNGTRYSYENPQCTHL